jgi:uracil phosphoribosyltransferase|tara:strand:- start:349 stop:975 length:627 start_codon:yes stop_codon:yes gene_type:complete
MSLNVLKHSLAPQYLNVIRSKATGARAFREAGFNIGLLICSEATRDLATEPVKVETPLETVGSEQLSDQLAVVSILRAGMAMVDSVLQFFPDVRVGVIGMERNEETAVATSYYEKLPDLEGRVVLLVDPMLATGGSAEDVLDRIYTMKPKEVRFLSIVAAPEGVARLEKKFPDLKIYAGALDRELNEKKYILPGLGDYGDRHFGTDEV